PVRDGTDPRDVGDAVGPYAGRAPGQGGGGHAGHRVRAVQRVPGRRLARDHEAATDRLDGRVRAVNACAHAFPTVGGTRSCAAVVRSGGATVGPVASNAAPTTPASAPCAAVSSRTVRGPGRAPASSADRTPSSSGGPAAARPPPITMTSGSSALARPVSAW